MRIAILTANTDIYREKEEDKAGTVIRKLVEDAGNHVVFQKAIAGIRGDVVIVNLPGKAGAVKECLSYLLPEITHAVEVVKGEA